MSPTHHTPHSGFDRFSAAKTCHKTPYSRQLVITCQKMDQESGRLLCRKSSTKSRRSLMAASVFSGRRESRESHLLHCHSLLAIRPSEPEYHCHIVIVISLYHLSQGDAVPQTKNSTDSPRKSFSSFILFIEIHLE